jgi:ribosomal protein L30/L7E
MHILKALMLRAIESGYANDTTFVADTDATSQMVNSTKYLTDITPITSEITTENDD